MSATICWPNIPMKNNTIQFPVFGRRSNSNSSQTSLGSRLNQSNGTWQNPGDIWTMSTTGAGASKIGRDVFKTDSGTNIDALENAYGSSVLAASSGSDVWLNSPWNYLRNTPPITQPQTERSSPSHSCHALPHATVSQDLLDAQNAYQQSSWHIFAHVSSLSRPSSKGFHSNDNSFSPFKYAQEVPSTHDMKEKTTRSYSSSEKPNLDSSGFPSNCNSTSHEVSMLGGPTDSESTSGNSMSLGNGNHITNGNFPLQNTVYSGQVPSLVGQKIDSRFDLPSTNSEASRVERISKKDSSPMLCPTNSTNNSYIALQNCPATNIPIWNQKLKPNSIKEPPSNQPTVRNLYNNNNKLQGVNQRSILPCNNTGSYPGMHSTGCRPQNIPVEFERHQMRSSQISQNINNLERKINNLPVAYSQSYMLGTPFQYPITPRLYEMSRATLRSRHPNLTPTHSLSTQSYQQSQLISSNPTKEHDASLGFRSILLEEFRVNTKLNKRYDLKDLYHHIVEFSGDQHGSRFIQTKLETANSEEKEQVFHEIQSNALQLMTDVYGNYVIQKLFEYGNQIQKSVLAEKMKNRVVELSLQMYGCRVVQKALEHVLDDQQAKLVEELKHDVLKCVKDQNGNHVIQKAIERVPSQKIQFLIDAFLGRVQVLAVHPYGCRVIQRILEFNKPSDRANILKELHECAEMLISDQYGNYVIQHVIQHGSSEDRDKIINLVTRQLLKFSKHKYASNVVEKSIIYGTEKQRRLITTLLTTSNNDGTSPLQLMMKDQFGNYVIQKLLAQLQGVEKIAFLNIMKIQLLQLKKNNFGKQIDIIEKLLFKTLSGIQNPTNLDPSDSIPTKSTETTANTLSTIYSSSLKNSNNYDFLATGDTASSKHLKVDEGTIIEIIPNPELVVHSL